MACPQADESQSARAGVVAAAALGLFIGGYALATQRSGLESEPLRAIAASVERSGEKPLWVEDGKGVRSAACRLDDLAPAGSDGARPGAPWCWSN